jgi:hypothetical protein
MSITNRRNALLGWAAWQIGKRVVRAKLAGARPGGARGGGRRRKFAALVPAALAVAAGIWFWRRQADDGADGPEQGSGD